MSQTLPLTDLTDEMAALLRWPLSGRGIAWTNHVRSTTMTTTTQSMRSSCCWWWEGWAVE